MKRRVLVLVLGLVLAAVAAGCGGGGGNSAAPPTTTTTGPARPKDPGTDALRRALKAVRSGDRVALWGLLSQPSRRRLGPTLAEFRRRGAPQVERSLRYFTTHPFRKIASERITGRFGVAGIVSGRTAYAAPLRLEQGTWKLELGRGPITVVSVSPQPRSVSRVGQLAFELHGPQGGAVAVLYADGITLDSREFTGPRSATIFANLASPLTPGVHNGLAFATAGDAAVAKAWTFVAR